MNKNNTPTHTQISKKVPRTHRFGLFSELFWQGALGLELHSRNFALCFSRICMVFTAFSKPFIPIFRTIFRWLHSLQGTP